MSLSTAALLDETRSSTFNYPYDIEPVTNDSYSPRILIVDDTPGIRSLLRKILNNKGFNIEKLIEIKKELLEKFPEITEDKLKIFYGTRLA